MEPALSSTVNEALVRLYEKDLVYRGEYIVNWALGLETAMNDLEVEYSEEEGKMYYFRYVVEGGRGGCVFAGGDYEAGADFGGYGGSCSS